VTQVIECLASTWHSIQTPALPKNPAKDYTCTFPALKKTVCNILTMGHANWSFEAISEHME
jgi:hypothetical protein